MQFRAAWNKDYKPDLARAFDHILIHTGAAAVITAVVKGLQLDPKAAVPSSEALERFGNTTMCSTYYILANIESQVRSSGCPTQINLRGGRHSMYINWFNTEAVLWMYLLCMQSCACVPGFFQKFSRLEMSQLAGKW